MFAWPLLAVALLAQAPQDTVLLDFYSDTCAPCRMMDPLVAQLIARGYPVQKVNVAQQPELAQRFRVDGVPCFVMLCRGREIDRQVGATSEARLRQMLDRAGSALAAESSSGARGQSPDPGSPGASDAFAAPTPLPLRGKPLGSAAAATGGAISTTTPPALAALETRLTQATVRLTVEDSQGNSFGSGTIIDAQADAALVLTCGHIFRDSQGRGRIKVLVSSASGPRELEGQLHSYGLEPDLALVVVRSVGPVQPAQIAGTSYRPAQGETVFTAGCDFGRPASTSATRITAIDKYLGPANLEVAGEPAQGRSGGGLFNARGELIGVCNAADPHEREGMYAGLSSIHEMLRKQGLAGIFEGSGDSALAATAAPVRPASAVGSQTAEGLDRSRAAIQEDPLVPVPLDSEAEVICIVRPLADPRAKSEIVVLDRASRNFMHLLSSEGRRQSDRHLTSLNVPQRPAPPARRGGPVESADGWRPSTGR